MSKIIINRQKRYYTKKIRFIKERMKEIKEELKVFKINNKKYKKIKSEKPKSNLTKI
jgi:hypothetical protein